MIKVMISDPDLFAREGIKQMLVGQQDIVVVHEANAVLDTFEGLRRLRPDVCIMEIAVGSHYGLRFVREAKTHAPTTPILVMSHHSERDFALRAFRAGAAGYIAKDCLRQELATAVRAAADGRAYVTETVCDLIAESVVLGGDKRPHENLDDSDFEILYMMIVGMTNAKIACIRNMTTSMVRARRARIKHKMGLDTEAHLVEYAFRNHLIDASYPNCRVTPAAVASGHDRLEQEV